MTAPGYLWRVDANAIFRERRSGLSTTTSTTLDVGLAKRKRRSTSHAEAAG